MNESDSDVEGKDRDGNRVDKDQLRRMEQNEVKLSRTEKKQERKAMRTGVSQKKIENVDSEGEDSE